MMKKVLDYVILVLLIGGVILLASCEKEEITPLGPDNIDDISDVGVVTPPNTTFDGGEYLTVPEFLSEPISGAELIVPTIIINYIESDNGVTVTDEFAELGGALDYADKPVYGMSVETVQNYFLGSDIRQKWSLEEGSRYHGQEDESVTPYLGFDVIEYINIYKMDFTEDGKIDYFKLFEKIGLEDKVENQGVKEVWINHFPNGYSIPESNM